MITVLQNKDYERYSQLALHTANEYFEKMYEYFEIFPERMTCMAEGGIALVYKFHTKKWIFNTPWTLHIEVDNEGEVVCALFKKNNCVDIKHLSTDSVKLLITSYNLIKG